MEIEQVKAEYKLWKEQNARDMKHYRYTHIFMIAFPYVMISIIVIGVIICFVNH